MITAFDCPSIRYLQLLSGKKDLTVYHPCLCRFVYTILFFVVIFLQMMTLFHLQIRLPLIQIFMAKVSFYPFLHLIINT